MRLPVMPPVAPMLASPVRDGIPEGDPGTLLYEPKWDGFRTLIFRDGPDVVVQGRSGDDLSYAFPEVVAMALESLPRRIVVDGELVVVSTDTLDFGALGSRLRPRSEAGGASIQRLSEVSPARFIAFDLLALDSDDLMAAPFRDRRELLASTVESTRFSGSGAADSPGLHVTPATGSITTAREWFDRFEGGGLDGLIVKRCADPYTPGKRTLWKVKHQRTLDVVVAGWRPHASSPDQVGSLLLGLHDAEGQLHHIGVSSGFSARQRSELYALLQPYASPDGEPHPWRTAPGGGHQGQPRLPGAVNRWSKGKDSRWIAVRPDLVAEVTYDQFEGDRLRHVAGWQRWRPDRDPGSCTYDQVVRPEQVDIRTVLEHSQPS